ncbi:tetratricopeptide repeat protein [Candidatus Pseudothioglobus singularis]|jgi:tetratricopeptide (TPR) repeat protein|nr:tetratricopeptide repeat protein [Candidatus Pseudothioglobus singularis]
MKYFSYRSVLCVSLLLMSFGAFSAEGLNVDLAILKINKQVKSLSNEILTLKDEIEILREKQRINSEKIDELLHMIELSQTNNIKSETSVENSPQPSKLFKDGKSNFVLGNYDKAIELFLSHLKNSPNDNSLTDTQLWLGRSYFYSESYLESKNAYLEFQILGAKHPKYADSLYELSRVHIELNETNEAKKLLTQMLKDYPNHLLFNKASTLIQSF